MLFFCVEKYFYYGINMSLASFILFTSIIYLRTAFKIRRKQSSISNAKL
ncbi:hypothetical protein ANASTE_02200 [Anaerofustis stercorihominis DSM 17244]|uniref:Uncharacterized protein n=1 Tax=Anaerofustis stercorihominis DSM 17244 TaxID=445971 RepID=B1CAK6_9FIRM|nr:hypothetical protein ANASTE_02200 [Anaerofustis stercorihominis DSM 17244]